MNVHGSSVGREWSDQLRVRFQQQFHRLRSMQRGKDVVMKFHVRCKILKHVIYPFFRHSKKPMQRFSIKMQMSKFLPSIECGQIQRRLVLGVFDVRICVAFEEEVDCFKVTKLSCRMQGCLSVAILSGARKKIVAVHPKIKRQEELF